MSRDKEEYCRFYLRGNCRYGTSCRFLHPSGNNQQTRRTDYDDHQYQSRQQIYSNYEDDDGGDDYYQPSGGGHRNYSSDNYRFGKASPLVSAPKFGGTKPPEPVSRDREFQQSYNSAAGGGREFQQTQNNSADQQEIVSTVQEQIEAWLQGNQWLFSCFSPLSTFNVPGLLDVSPEELRFEAYNAKRINKEQLYESYVKLLIDKTTEAREALRNPSATMAQILVKLHRGEIQGSSLTSSFLPAVPQQQAAPNSSTLQSFSFKLGPASSSSGSIYSQTANVAPSETFGDKAANSQTSIFGAGTSTQTSLFGGTTITKSSVLSGDASSETTINFGAPPSRPSSIFGATQPPSFGALSSTQTPTFSQVPQAGGDSSVVTAQSRAHSRIHTPLEELTDAEKSEFTAVRFSSLKGIPTKPPPLELCR